MQNKTYISINKDKNSGNFNNVIINDTKIRDIEFNDCEFINVTINTELLNSSFIDCTFKNCDLSNINLSESLFRRVKFIDCKLLGTELSASSFKDVTFKNTLMNYSNFSYSKIENVEFCECILDNSSFNYIERIKNIEFNNSSLIDAEIINTSLNKEDISTANITVIKINPSYLKGLCINMFQAADIISYLGIKIR